MRLRFVWQINSRLYYMRYIYGTVKMQLSSNVNPIGPAHKISRASCRPITFGITRRKRYDAFS